MTSPLLALFNRSLREDSHLKFTYFSRAALVLLLLFFLWAEHATFGWANAPGLQFFGVVVSVNLCAVVLAGISYFSSAISEEKEEMTLGLLRMTDLNSLSILLGKSTSRLCTALLLFAAQIPFTLLAITLGGISLRQICAAYVAIGAFLLFIGNLALFFSVVARRTSTSAVFTGATLVFFFAVVPLANWFAQLPVRMGLLEELNAWTTSLDAIATTVEDTSPFTHIGKILTTGFAGDIFTFQVGSDLLLGLFFFLLAWAVFERFCGEQKETAPARAGAPRAQGRRSALGPGRTWRRALAWKDFYFTTGGKVWVLIKLAIYGVPLAAIRCWPHQLGGPPSWDDFFIGVFWFMLLFLFVELAFSAATIFRNEHQGQTLSSLAMLPQGIRRIAYEKLLGILPSLCAAGVYFALGLFGIAKHFLSEPSRFNFTGHGALVLIFTFTQALFFLHFVAVLSLYVKRGALPLAIGGHFILILVLGITLLPMSHDPDSAMIFPILLLGGVTAYWHFHIGTRLETLAAEE